MVGLKKDKRFIKKERPLLKVVGGFNGSTALTILRTILSEVEGFAQNNLRQLSFPCLPSGRRKLCAH